MSNQPLDLIQRELARQGALVGTDAVEPESGLRPQPVAPPSAAHTSAAVRAGIAAGNINIAEASERLEFSEESLAQANRQEELLADFERRRQARNITVPTDDGEVKLGLREFGEPVCLFGEGPAERRNRLRDLLLKSGKTVLRKRKAEEEAAADQEMVEVWYHKGPAGLLDCRLQVADYSLHRARERLKRARLQLAKPDPNAFAEKQKFMAGVRAFGNKGSQVGDTRPIGFCEYSPDGKWLATAGWSSLCKLWSMPDLECTRTLRGHGDRAGCITWHPGACVSQDPAAVNLASSDVQGGVHLWSLDASQEEPIASLPGHSLRVPRLRFHPSGEYLATSCFDHSWRLWNVAHTKEVLHQEGHSRPVFDVDFHPDGSLVGTSSLDASSRVWDLRSGKCILVLSGHVKPVLSLRFSPNGYHIATGSDDHTIRLWDLRKRKSFYTLPAHQSIVSSLRYDKNGEMLVSSGFDNVIKIWSMPMCNPLKTLEGHDGKVMCVDISPDQSHTIVSASYDRTIKLWGPD